MNPDAVYGAVGLVGLLLADDGAAGEPVTIRQDHRRPGYQLAAMLGFLIFAAPGRGRIEGPEETVWFWLSSDRGELLIVSGVLRVVSQLPI